MQSQGHTLFSAINQRCLSGKPLTAYFSQKELRIKAGLCIKRFSAEATKNEILEVANQIQLFACLGADNAIKFYEDLFNPRTLDARNLDLLYNNAKEIGLTAKQPLLLYYLYRFKSCVDIKNSYVMPDIKEALYLLENAATMRGVSATLASYTLAYLYSSELKYHYKDILPAQLRSLQAVYLDFERGMRRKRQFERSRKLIKTRVEGIQTLAEEGCKFAIHALIEWYQLGKASLHISQDLSVAAKWREALSERKNTLKEKFKKYFELAMQHTIENGYYAVGENKVDIHYFQEVFENMTHSKDCHALTKQHLFKEKFKISAHQGNVKAAAFLARMALTGVTCVISPIIGVLATPVNMEEAISWSKLATKSPLPRTTVSGAPRKMYEQYRGEDEATRLSLLENAHQAGCVESSIELGKRELEARKLIKATYYFCSALAMTNDIETPRRIKSLVIAQKKCDEALSIIMYTYELCSIAIERGCLLTISEIINDVKDLPSEQVRLLHAWVNLFILRKLNIAVEVALDVINFKELLGQTVFALCNHEMSREMNTSLSADHSQHIVPKMR